MIMTKGLFYALLETGQIKVTSEGLVTILGEYALFFPARVFLYWQDMLISKYKSEGKGIMYEMGRYQVTQALKRYTKNLGIQKVDRTKIMTLTMKIISMIGHGTFRIGGYDFTKGTASISNPKLPLADAYRLTRPTSKEPTDFYVSGLLAGMMAALSGKDVKCVETKCLTKGDKICHFELSPMLKLKFKLPKARG